MRGSCLRAAPARVFSGLRGLLWYSHSTLRFGGAVVFHEYHSDATKTPHLWSANRILAALDFSLCKTVNLSSYQMHSKISDVFSFNAKEI